MIGLILVASCSDSGGDSAGEPRAAAAHVNRLIHEKSPYLRQHAHNPVDWYPWGPRPSRVPATSRS
jgi:hypothetical protein